jgi:hypothetical protein
MGRFGSTSNLLSIAHEAPRSLHVIASLARAGTIRSCRRLPLPHPCYASNGDADSNDNDQERQTQVRRPGAGIRTNRVVTLPRAQAKGLLGPANETELLAGCPPELLGTTVPRYVETSKRTAHVVPNGSFSVGTPRTRDRLCRCTGLAATKPGFIAQANICTIARRSPGDKEPFTPCLKAGALWP